MTPFQFEEGRRALGDIFDFCPNGQGAALNRLVWYLNMMFDLVTEPDQQTEDGDPYDPAADGVDAEIGYDIWVCAAMLDAALNGTDYAADCTGFTETYEHVRETMQKKLHETKFLSKKPKHDLPALRRKAAEALRFITGEICESEAADSMGEQRDAFVSSVHDLAERLSASETGQISAD